MSLLRFIFSKTFVKHLLAIALVVLVAFAGLYFYLESYTGHDETIEVPDLSGLTIDEVEAKLQDFPFSYEVIDSVYNEGEYGTILDQIPSSGSKVKEGRVIFLTVNASSEPMKTLNIEVGETLRIAATKLEILGIEYETVFKPAFCNSCVLEVLHKGKPVKSGDKVRKGDKITLILGEQANEKVPVPSLYGMRLDSARALLSRSSLSLGYPFYDEDVKSTGDSSAARVYSQRPKAGSRDLKAGSPVDVWLTNKELSNKEIPAESEKDLKGKDLFE
jgi:beta-lactam-binding protein with PASTA domain